MAPRKTSEATRSILVHTQTDTLIVENVPASAKVTFGKLQPGKDGGYDRSNALRIYTSANNQLAVFTNVLDFRDLSLTVKARKVKSKVSRKAEVGPNGKTVEATDEEEYEFETVDA